MKEPSCRMECKSLSTKDYTDLWWTTVAEFPGELLPRFDTFASDYPLKALCIRAVHLCVCVSVINHVLEGCGRDLMGTLPNVQGECARDKLVRF